MDITAIIKIDGYTVREIDISSFVEHTVTVTDEAGLGAEIASEIDGYTP